jgi:ferredoxin
LRGGHPPTFHGDLVILAAPVYYGRVPEEAASYFATLTAERTPVVLVVVYGNREFDDALKELHDIAAARGFIPVAGGAFVAEHSYSSSAHPIAQGRPDESDLRKARQFGAAVREKLRGLESLDTMSALAVPGKVPYVEPRNLMMIREARATVSFTPETDTAMCTQCGQCAEACPTGAISPDDVTKTDKWQCLICFACVKSCPVGARQMNDPFFRAAIQELHEACQERKEPELYLSGSSSGGHTYTLDK